MSRKRLLASAFLSVLVSTGAFAQEEAAGDEWDMDMSLEDLMGMEITSASKKAERLQDVSSAIYVINQDDIKRSSATRIVELLQQVPGFWLVDNGYTLTESNARGATGGFVGTMLVLVDGVPVQNPLSSQMDYSSLDLPLNEIERIEVIRGPGGTIYGANAATGVVNIFTKNSFDRNETYTQVEYGDNNFINANIGISKNINDKSSISVYGKARLYDGHDKLSAFDGANPSVPYALGDVDEKSGDSVITNQINQDIWSSEAFTLGGKYNLNISENTKLAVSGIANSFKKNGFAVSTIGYIPQINFADSSYIASEDKIRFTGNAKLDHSFNDNHSVFLNASYNHQSGNTSIQSGYHQQMDMIDLEIQDNFTYKFNNLSVGGNIRNVRFNISDIVNENNINYRDKTNNDKLLYGAFIQNKMSFFNDKLDVIIGAKGEVWQLVSNEMYFSPSLKFAYKPNEKHTIWGSASRAVTTPGFIHTNIALEVVNFGSFEDWAPAATFQTAQYLLANNQASDMNDALMKATTMIQNDPSIVNNIFAFATGENPNSLGRSIKITNTETTPSIYDWVEIGYRTSAIKNVTIEVNAFGSVQRDMINAKISNDGGYIEDPTSPGDSIIPFYYTNMRDGKMFGGEFNIKAMPTKYLTLEASYALLKTFQTDIESGDTTKAWHDENETPVSTIKFKAYLDLPKGFAVNITGDWADRFNAGDSYDYVNQRWPSLTTGSPYDFRMNEWNNGRLRLNAKITKKFMDGKLTAYLWGNDLLEDGSVVRVRQFSASVPTQLQRMYGVGLIANF